MGYRPQRRTFRLRFEDEAYEGLIVRARSVSIGSLLGVAGLASLDPTQLRPEDLAVLGELSEVFADALLDWNLEDPDSGEPVPATLAGVKAQDTDFILPIIKAWFEGVAGVAGPLGPRSTDGPQSGPPPIPMEPRTVNQAS